MGDSPEKLQCLFCLEEETADNILIQINYQQYYSIPTCACRITTHTGCYIQYSTHKGRSECPICHRIYESEQPQPPIVPPAQIQEYIIIENRLYQHQPSLPIVTPEETHTICIHPSRTIRFSFLCSIIIMCAILFYLRR
jgi:hypothetical protein